MTDNRLPDLLAKIAIDPAFAEYVQNYPEAFADEYGLDAKAVAMLESLSVSDAADGPAPLAERLSRSSLFFGGSLAAAGDVHPADGSGADVHDDGLSAASGQASGKIHDGIAGRSLLGPEKSAGIIGPDGPADGLREPGGLAEDDDGFRPIFHPPTGRIDDGFDDGIGGPGGLDGDGIEGPHGLHDGLDGGLDDGIGGAGGLDGKLGGLDGKLGGLDGKLGGLDGKLGGLDGKLGGLDGKLGGLDGDLHGGVTPGDIAVGTGEPGALATGASMETPVAPPPVTGGGGGEHGGGQQTGSGHVTVHDDDGSTHDYEYKGPERGFVDQHPGEDGAAHHDGGTGGAVGGGEGPHGGEGSGASGGGASGSGGGASGSGGDSHPDDDGHAPAGDGEGSDPNRAPRDSGDGGDPNQAPKGDGEGGDPNRAPAGDGEGSDANAGTVSIGGQRAATSSAGAVFLPPTGLEDPTGGAAAAAQTPGEGTS